MKQLSEEDINTIIDKYLRPTFTYMDPEFAAIVLTNMLKDFMNTKEWNQVIEGRKAHMINTVGALTRLLNDLDGHFMEN